MNSVQACRLIILKLAEQLTTKQANLMPYNATWLIQDEVHVVRWLMTTFRKYGDGPDKSVIFLPDIL